MDRGDNARRGRIARYLAVALFAAALVACGSDSAEEPGRECSSNADCSSDQPHCLKGECYPCLEDGHCPEGMVCVNNAPGKNDPGSRHCSECDPTDRDPWCDEGRVCDLPVCFADSRECTGRGYCHEPEACGREGRYCVD